MNTATVRLLKSFDAEKLQKDLETAVKHFDMAAQMGSYHDGSWKGITLRNSTGDHADTMAFSTSKAQDTAVMELCPYFRDVLRELNCPVNVARLLFLPPGKVIGEHTDSGLGFDAGLLRLHIPIVTHAKVQFKIGGENVHWKPGEFWYGDFSLPHSLHNQSDIVRVHLVLDCEITPETLQLFPPDFITVVRSQAPIVETVGLNLAPEELERLTGFLKLTGRMLGVPLPIVARLRAEAPYLKLTVPGIPMEYFLTAVDKQVLRSNLHQLTWSGSAGGEAGKVAVEYCNLKTGAKLPFEFNRRNSAQRSLYILFQGALLGVGYGLFVVVNKLKRAFNQARPRSLES